MESLRRLLFAYVMLLWSSDLHSFDMAMSDFFCRGRHNGMYNSPSDCSEYVTCSNGRAMIQKCPPGLYYDETHNMCDFPYNLNCVDGRREYRADEAVPADRYEPLPVEDAYQSLPVQEVRHHEPEQHISVHEPSMVDTVHAEVPDPSSVHLIFPEATNPVDAVSCAVDGYYADTSDCNHYILCVQGIRYVRPCPPGTYYSHKTSACGYARDACYLTPLSSEHEKTSTNDSPSAPDVFSPSFTIKVPYNAFSTATTTKQSRPTNPSRNTGEWTVVGRALQEAMAEARVMTLQKMRMESQKARSLPATGSGAFSGVQAFLGSTPLVKQISIPAVQQLQALRLVKQRYALAKDDITKLMNHFRYLLEPSDVMVQPDMSMTGVTPGALDVCPYPRNSAANMCEPGAPYRTVDGTCNNLERPLWGRSFRPLNRFLPPDYADGISEPRIARDSMPLPSARAVTSLMMEDRDRPSHVHTILTMTFGQLIDHDLTKTAISKLNTKPNGDGDKVDVTCGEDGCQTEGVENAACLPITVPRGDTDFGNKSCLMFVRTQEVPLDECALGPREQMNQLTSYLDASQTYGSTKEDMEKLRDREHPERGRLRGTRNGRYRLLLPQNDNPDCREVDPTIRCFRAGDERVNEQVGLTALHTALMRMHNVVESRMHILNPHWSGETLFQETRRLIGAIWQHLIYNEWLPLVLGPGKLREFGLELNKQGYYNAYDASVNVEVSNSFATAAFRFAHSMIDNQVAFSSRNYDDVQFKELSEVLRRPEEIYKERYGSSGVDAVLHGQMSQPMQTVDRFFSKQITSRLFSENPPFEPGLDLPALNIQRGREHGIPGYNAWREWCGLRRVNSFDELVEVPSESRDILRKAYRHVDDIDLFPGGIAERTVSGGLTGPTFACIIGRQFRKARVGDRFWYEREDAVTGFTPAQLSEIRKASIARLMCDCADRMDTIQPFVLLQPISVAFKTLGPNNYQDAYSLASLYRGDNNERRPCSEIPAMDFSVFKET